ncbi:hypothetical protein ACFE04_017892 [Oxalis oulophora]
MAPSSKRSKSICQRRANTQILPYRQWLDMLSHLPAKSLVRFSCVSKAWNILIGDSNFVELHRQLSLWRPAGTGLIVIFKHAFSKLLIIRTEYNGTPMKQSITSNMHDRFSQVVNGLVCLLSENLVSLCNIFTHEYLHILPSKLNLVNHDSSSVIRSYLFGFDPATRVYKILNINEIKNTDGFTSYQFEIFSLGVDKSWRKIHPPKYDFSSHFFTHDNYLYVNGTFYWIQHKENINRRFTEFFNLSDEKFYRIGFPMIEGPCNLIDIHGRLAIAMWPEKQIDNSFVIKLWMLHKSNKWDVEYIVIRGLQGFSHPYPIGSLLTGDILIMDNKFTLESNLVFYDLKNRTIKGVAPIAKFMPMGKNPNVSKMWSRFKNNLFKEVNNSNTFTLSITDSVEHVFPLKKKYERATRRLY